MHTKKLFETYETIYRRLVLQNVEGNDNSEAKFVCRRYQNQKENDGNVFTVKTVTGRSDIVLDTLPPRENSDFHNMFPVPGAAK